MATSERPTEFYLEFERPNWAPMGEVDLVNEDQADIVAASLRKRGIATGYIALRQRIGIHLQEHYGDSLSHWAWDEDEFVRDLCHAAAFGGR